MDTVTPRELEAVLLDGIDIVLVNLLDANAFEQVRIPKSHNLPASAEDFVERMEELAGSKHRTIVVYGTADYSAESEGATRKLVDAGFTDVMHLEDGIEGWIESGLKVESGYA